MKKYDYTKELMQKEGENDKTYSRRLTTLISKGYKIFSISVSVEGLWELALVKQE